MEWPVLGRNRAQPGKRSFPTEEEPRQSKKRQTQPDQHWNMKLAIVFKAKAVPEGLQKMIEEFAIPERFMRFFKKYGPRRAQYCGSGFVTDWHPSVASTTRDRYIWCVFTRKGYIWRVSPAMRWPEKGPMETAKSLEGHMVLIV